MDDLPRYIKNAKSTLAGFGASGTLLFKFYNKYKTDWNSDFGEAVREDGYENARAFFNNYKNIFSINGSSIRIILDDSNESAKKMFAALGVEETKKKYFKKNNIQKSSSRTSYIPENPISRNSHRDPYACDDEDDIVELSNSRRQQYSRSESRFENTQSPMNGSERPKFYSNNGDGNRSNFSPFNSYSNGNNESHENVYPSSTFDYDANDVQPPAPSHFSQSSNATNLEVIEKDNVLVYRCSLEEMIAWVGKNLHALFEDVLSYGNSNILPLEKVKEFIERMELHKNIDLQKFAYLCTFFTNWAARKQLLEMEFSIQPNSTPVVEFYKQFISVPPNVVEINSVLPGKIIGIDDEENLIIRPESLGVSYSHLKTKMRTYYLYFRAQGVPNRHFGSHVTDVFQGDYALYNDEENSRFLRCIVSDVMESGQLVIAFLDEGCSKKCSPSKLFPIPRKFREIEPLCLVFKMSHNNLNPLEKDKHETMLLKAGQLIKTGAECHFKIMKCEERSFLPDLFVGPWKQSI